MQVITEATVRLIDYLNENCGGIDRHLFRTATGEPDIEAARAFADMLREQCGDAIGEILTVEQRNHQVVVTSLIEWDED
jgi:hypothetical protein